MKKFFIVSFFILSLIFMCTVSNAQDGVSVYLNGQKIEFDTQPTILNGRTMVPVRAILEAAGAIVGWDGTNNMITAEKDGTTISFGIGSNTMAVKKYGRTEVIELDVAPCLINERTYVAIKHVAENLGINVGWNGEMQRVILDSNYKVSSVPNKIEFSDFYLPEGMRVGDYHNLSGSILADGVIDRVNIKVTDKNSGRIHINETQFGVNEEYYYYSDYDNKLKFGRLSPGVKLLEITAVTKNETRAVFSGEFYVDYPVLPQLTGNSTMLWPVPKSGFISTIFWCNNVQCHSNGGRSRGHAALDIAAPENFDVLAVKDGTVIRTVYEGSKTGTGGYGNYILIDHGNGLTTQYSHLYSIFVSEGDYVFAGQVIGGVGTTGNSTGNHLDFAIEQNGVRVDPLTCLEMHPRVRCFEECDRPIFIETLAQRGIQAPENDEYYFYDYY
ncbi:MAG: peptidoglycan DD-metalloendopeptidase family protein [Clostridia bacterium]|nr:peptidoglycan DD-metalloendopeptidase family protein [Clostridia bacterium]